MKTKIIIILISLCLMGGCTIYRPIIQETGHFYYDKEYDITSMSSVTVVQPVNYTNYNSATKPFARSLTGTIRKKHLFIVNTMDSSSPFWKYLKETNFKIFTNEDLKNIREQVQTDGLIFGSITHYKPFPASTIAVNLKMIDLRNGRIVWSIEQIWDTTDIAVERRMKRFYKENVRSGYEPMDWEIVRVSPKIFNKFVTYEICSTLPANTYYDPEYLKEEKSLMRIKDQMLRPVIRFPQKVNEVVGMNDN